VLPFIIIPRGSFASTSSPSLAKQASLLLTISTLVKQALYGFSLFIFSYRLWRF